MEFRHPKAAADANAVALKYLTESLSNPKQGKLLFEKIIDDLGNSVDMYPGWHPIMTIPPTRNGEEATTLSQIEAYDGVDHTVLFVRGFVTCPYGESTADKLVENINSITGLHARRLDTPLYHDTAYPVLVSAWDIELEADGTIRSRDALAWCVQSLVKEARKAEVGEPWWNLRTDILGTPHGSRSSLFVNQYTGGHIRKILEALNNSGMYGPIKEWSLEMLSAKKRAKISETLIRTAIDNWDKSSSPFEFELRGELCKATVNDTWSDGFELSIQVTVGDHDLYTRGFYYPRKDLLEPSDPNGKRTIAEKFL